MRSLHITYIAALVIATLILLVGALQIGSSTAAFVALVPAVMWLLGWYFQQRFALTLTFVLFIGLIGLASYGTYPPMALVIAMLAAYVLWDVEAFAARLARFDNEEAFRAVRNRPNLIRQHLLATGGIVGGTLILSLITLNSTLQIGFWPAVALSTVLAIGLTQALRYLRESDL